jgi:hypothetical protein
MAAVEHRTAEANGSVAADELVPLVTHCRGALDLHCRLFAAVARLHTPVCKHGSCW